MTKKATTLKAHPETIIDTPISNNPLVFISHDTRDAKLAEAFSQLLSNSSMGILESFRSSDKTGQQGIEYGTLWYEEILKKLNEASDVVCLLTHHSIDRPWILYEAGIAIGKSNTPLIGIALGIPLNKASNGPFAQFQNCADDIESLTKLICNLVKKIPNAKPVEDVIKGQVQLFIDKIKPIIEVDSAQKTEVPASAPLVEDTQVAKLFEEIKIMFQDLPSRIDRNSYGEGNRRVKRFEPMLLDELMHNTKDPNVSFLIILSMFRNEFSWIYELGIDLIKNLKVAKSTKDKEALIRDYDRLLEISMHSSYFQEALMRSKEEHRNFRDLPRLLMNALHRLLDSASKESQL